MSPLSTPSGLKQSPWSRLDDATRSEIKNLLLKALVNEKSEAVVHKICDAVAEVARTTLLAQSNNSF